MPQKKIQRLVGLLNHACKVVIPGRLYVYNIYGCLRHLETTDRVKLCEGFWEDLLWWVRWLRTRNGIDIGVGDRCYLCQEMSGSLSRSLVKKRVEWYSTLKV